MRKELILNLILTSLVVVLLVLSVTTGSVSIALEDVLSVFFNPKAVSSGTAYIIRNIRLTRALGAVCVGALLSLSGLVFQSVFRNPLSDSYMLGISSASSFAVSIMMFFELSYALSLGAFAGAVLCALFVFTSAKADPVRLILTGIACNFFFSAMTTLLIYMGRRKMETVLFWSMGSLSGLEYSSILLMTVMTILFTLFALHHSDAMDLLLTDDSTALSSGLDINRERLVLLTFASICTAVCVANCGIIGFVGLVSPHIVRIILGPKHRRMIIPSMLTGALILLTGDVIARTVIRPSELPVGIITSIIGAPFLFLMLRRRSLWQN